MSNMMKSHINMHHAKEKQSLHAKEKQSLLRSNKAEGCEAVGGGVLGRDWGRPRDKAQEEEEEEQEWGEICDLWGKKEK